MAGITTPFWNTKHLEPPSINSLPIICQSPERVSTTLAQMLEDVISQLNDLKLLHHDAALMCRMLYRTKKTLRNHKGYKCLQKVKQCLANYLPLDLLSTITQIRHTAYGTKGPSKEVLEWGLISLLRFSALFHRLQQSCVECGYHMNNHIRTGDNWHLAILFLSFVSRIWAISRYLVSQACDWYLELIPFLSQLQTHGKWLPDNYVVPSDLKSWLGNPDYLIHSPKISRKEGHENYKNVNISLAINEDFGGDNILYKYISPLAKPAKWFFGNYSVAWVQTDLIDCIRL